MDRPVAKPPTWQHTTLTTDRYPCPRWDSNPQSQQTIGRRPSPRNVNHQNHHPQHHWLCNSVRSNPADPSGRAMYGVDLQPIPCWNCGFKSRRGHGCLCCVLYVMTKRQNSRKSRNRKKYGWSTNRVQQNNKKNPGGGKIFCTRPGHPWGPSSLLHNGYRVSFPEVRRPGRGANHLLPSSTEVTETVELYLYSPSGSSWPVFLKTQNTFPISKCCTKRATVSSHVSGHICTNTTCIGLITPRVSDW
jgi:hypothetical protein